MALLKEMTLESGLIIEQAYIRVQGLNGNKGVVAISLEIFLTRELCEEGKSPIAFLSFAFEPDENEDSPRWDKQAYKYLKTLPEFYGAIDA
ncbi:hypothetical protein [Paenibacillus odorifer]|uniref:hypothetical protein n=1 Tax=Paenibacillus TaxID=44249 RepID=UPI00096EC68B|nr:hypothetical protein [Paenibacillus odorifer]OMC93788.1 hypothetical protein BJP46_30920 [Paenibacillus odorifer]